MISTHTYGTKSFDFSARQFLDQGSAAASRNTSDACQLIAISLLAYEP